MAFRYYADSNGDTIKLYDNDGIMSPVPVLNWHAMTQLTSRDDDVLICSYPKSGTHWIWEIVQMLKTGSQHLSTVDMKSQLLFMADPERLNKMESPRVLITHRHFHDLPTDFIIKKRKLVLMVRDPKDVCVSYYDFAKAVESLEYNGAFKGFIELFLQGKVSGNSWSRWVLSYEKGLKEHPELPYHVVRFEELKLDPVAAIGRLAEFLEVSPSLVETTAEQTQFARMKAGKSKPDDPYSAFFKDRKGNEHIFRRGMSGEWKQEFTDEGGEKFEQELCQQLGRSSIEPLLF